MLENLINNTELMSVAMVVIPFFVQMLKQRTDLDPRIINGLISGVFAVVVVLIQIGITGLKLSEVLSHLWAYGLTAWTLATAFYKLAHNKKEEGK